MQFTNTSKENLQFISSLVVLFAGLILVFISLFIKPTGEIHPSVITAFGMFLSFVGAVWHLDLKYDFKTKELEHKVNSKLEQDKPERDKLERDKPERDED